MDNANFIPDPDNLAFKRIFESIESTRENFLITGKAGTGKSTLLRYFCQNTAKNVVILAPTGIAAINVGGQTIHSFFGFPFRPLVKQDEEIKKYQAYHPKHKIIKNMDTLVIDEISMVRADILDAIDHSLRINGGKPYLPFGGKQIIMVGDLFQLEPVVTNSKVEHEMFNEYYSSPYFFSAQIIQDAPIHCLELKKIYRQSDPTFIRLLNQVRLNQADWDTLDLLNERYNPHHSFDVDSFGITLCSRNQTASAINDLKMDQIESPRHIYKGEIDKDFNIKNLPTELILVLKEGAQVMFIKNDIKGNYVNGTIGKIASLSENKIEVLLPDGKTVEVQKEIWENKYYSWDRESGKIKSEILGTFTQYPLRPAWAITIHKSQGMTFDEVVLELSGGTFAHGQLYVALSRCKSLEGLTLTAKIKPSDIIVDSRVVEFAESNFIEVE